MDNFSRRKNRIWAWAIVPAIWVMQEKGNSVYGFMGTRRKEIHSTPLFQMFVLRSSGTNLRILWVLTSKSVISVLQVVQSLFHQSEPRSSRYEKFSTIGNFHVPLHLHGGNLSIPHYLLSTIAPPLSQSANLCSPTLPPHLPHPYLPTCGRFAQQLSWCTGVHGCVRV